jgi:predicted transcriptional regulator
VTVLFSLRIPADVLERLSDFADGSGATKAEHIRAAIVQYLDFHTGKAANLQRLAELAEFNQLVLDQLVRRDFPDLREKLLDAVEDRMEQFHGR